ncbi:Probable acyl-[acyl-carrier protein] desaturase DesA1 [Mycobacteroides abscessus]|nr:Probable acyl-[acyl-carrier protein] desaturase DesA1 [Mycobacteroides abscessus]
MAQKEFTDLELLHELEPVVEENTHRHLGVFKEWNPHDYIPWSDGKNYKALGGPTGSTWPSTSTLCARPGSPPMMSGLSTTM